MTASTIETVRTLLVSVLAEVDDPELRYRQRTALQLVDWLEECSEVARIALEQADAPPAVRERLEQLSSLE